METELIHHPDFFKVVLDSYQEIVKLEKEVVELQKDFHELPHGMSLDEFADLVAEKGDHIHRLAMTVIVFSAMALEAYINDYAIRYLSDNYFKVYFDKSDLLSKWVIIPRLTTGKQLDAGSEPVQDLSWLMALYNKLVHYKSTVIKEEQMHSGDFVWGSDAQRAVNAVRNLVLELAKIDERADTCWLELDIDTLEYQIPPP